MIERRKFLLTLAGSGLLLTPAGGLLTGCGKSGWPEGMVEIKWDRDTCARCSMAISDRRFAAEISGGPRGAVFKFDDIGCLVFWLRDKLNAHQWMAGPEARLWVADVGNGGERLDWLDPRTAFYVEKTSPMGYNFGAVRDASTGGIDFESMRLQILAMGK